MGRQFTDRLKALLNELNNNELNNHFKNEVVYALCEDRNELEELEWEECEDKKEYFEAYEQAIKSIIKDRNRAYHIHSNVFQNNDWLDEVDDENIATAMVSFLETPLSHKKESLKVKELASEYYKARGIRDFF